MRWGPVASSSSSHIPIPSTYLSSVWMNPTNSTSAVLHYRQSALPGQNTIHSIYSDYPIAGIYRRRWRSWQGKNKNQPVCILDGSHSCHFSLTHITNWKYPGGSFVRGWESTLPHTLHITVIRLHTSTIQTQKRAQNKNQTANTIGKPIYLSLSC